MGIGQSKYSWKLGFGYLVIMVGLMVSQTSQADTKNAELDAASQERLVNSAIWLAGHGPVLLEQGGAVAVMKALSDKFMVGPAFTPVVDHPLQGRFRFSPKSRGLIAFVTLVHDAGSVQFWHMRMEPTRDDVPVGDVPCLAIIALPQGDGLPARIGRTDTSLIMQHPMPGGGVARLPEDDALIGWRLRGWEHPECVAGTPYEGREVVVDASGAHFVR